MDWQEGFKEEEEECGGLRKLENIYNYLYFRKFYCKLRQWYYFKHVSFVWIDRIGNEVFFILTTTTTAPHTKLGKKTGTALTFQYHAHFCLPYILNPGTFHDVAFCQFVILSILLAVQVCRYKNNQDTKFV